MYFEDAVDLLLIFDLLGKSGIFFLIPFNSHVIAYRLLSYVQCKDQWSDTMPLAMASIRSRICEIP